MTDTNITFTQVLDRARERGLTAVQVLVLGMVLCEGVYSLKQMAGRLGVCAQTCKIALTQLRRQGLVQGDLRRRDLRASL